MIDKLKSWYTFSKRKEVTFQKLYEHPYLSQTQIDRLKTAQALFEVIPIALYAPYLFLMMRVVAKANTSVKLMKFTALFTLTAPSVELTSRYLKDHYYWPLVKQTYLEVKEQ